MRNLLTLDEVAAKTRVPVATLRYWRSRGEGPKTFRLGRRVVAFEDAVDEWVRSCAESEPTARSGAAGAGKADVRPSSHGTSRTGPADGDVSVRSSTNPSVRRRGRAP